MRNWKQLKEEGLAFAPKGFVYVGKGGVDLQKTFKESKNIYSYNKKFNQGRLKEGWSGIDCDYDYFVTEKIWSEKFGECKIAAAQPPTPRSEIHQVIKRAIITQTKNGKLIQEKVPVAIFVARKTNKNKVAIGYSRVHPLDGFDHQEGLNIARKNAKTDFSYIQSRKLSKVFKQFVERAGKFFKDAELTLPSEAKLQDDWTGKVALPNPIRGNFRYLVTKDWGNGDIDITSLITGLVYPNSNKKVFPKVEDYNPAIHGEIPETSL